MSNKDSEKQSSETDSLSADEMFEVMEPFEPYTLDDLVQRFDVTKGSLWSLLRTLHQAGKIRKKESGPNQRVWVREPPSNQCSNCDYEFQVKLSHPVLGSVQFCPHCGTKLQ